MAERSAADHRTGRGWHRMVPLWPLVLLVGLAGLEFANSQWVILELTVLSPLLAATVVGPRLTTMYGALAVVAVVALGVRDHLYGSGSSGWPAQAVRLGGVAAGGAMAVLLSSYHTRRETKLANVTRVAEAVQRTILTPIPVRTAHLRLAARYESSTAEANVGGDFYAVVAREHGARLLIGDVRGKGLEAVRLASLVTSCFRVVTRQSGDLGTVLRELDAEVASAGMDDDFATALVMDVEGGHVRFTNAGHPDPVLIRDGQAWLLEPPGRQLPLGLGSAGDVVGSACLEPGDRLLLYTDGIAEARDPVTRAFFPLLPGIAASLGTQSAGADHADRLDATGSTRSPTSAATRVPTAAHRPPPQHPPARAPDDAGTVEAQPTDLDTALDHLIASVHAWSGGALHDDVALLAVEILTPPTRSD
ncbi:Protein serine/threonine phosphatase [Frankia canadensis]|uniref:Protein serine/threonine phosphatase n=1 Tax=Frankia canadensis TaxID=1836972 RepID=A0A2I2KXR6_9ACTN|nr:PP2C family protein-serine/threonine phosphatase [Frankia canadensis]SNQ50455.1 Protein serine/threonine phosphatase [Frankia canadensis]SOU57745.1 Protein serine/threonine phosphatase [Frankia canadensis]